MKRVGEQLNRDREALVKLKRELKRLRALAHCARASLARDCELLVHYETGNVATRYRLRATLFDSLRVNGVTRSLELPLRSGSDRAAPSRPAMPPRKSPSTVCSAETRAESETSLQSGHHVRGKS